MIRLIAFIWSRLSPVYDQGRYADMLGPIWQRRVAYLRLQDALRYRGARGQFNRAEAFHILGRLEDSAKILRRLREYATGDLRTVALHCLAEVEFERGHADLAFSIAGEAHAAAEFGFWLPRELQAKILIAQARYEEAIQLLRAALEESGPAAEDSGASHNLSVRLSEALHKAGRNAEATELDERITSRYEASLASARLPNSA